MLRMLIAVLTMIAVPALAQDDGGIFMFADDGFLAGRTVDFDEPGKDDLFMAGSTLRGDADIAGSFHAAGRSIRMTGAVGGDAYAAGMDVVLLGPVAGDASVFGNTVSTADVAGDLRAAGGLVVIEGDIGGYALIAGEEIRVEGVIAGDAYLQSPALTFAETARVEGRLVVFENEDAPVSIPESVAPTDRVERRALADFDEMYPEIVGPDLWWGALRSFVMGIIVLTLLASLVAATMPDTLAQMRRALLARPFANLFYGFLAQSTVAGTAIIFAMTLIGMLLIPASLLLAFLLGFAGYVVAVYALGVWLSMLFGRPEPTELGHRVIAAALGALAIGLVALIPFFGWLLVLSLVLAGVGAITLRVFRPRFFASD